MQPKNPITIIIAALIIAQGVALADNNNGNGMFGKFSNAVSGAVDGVGHAVDNAADAVVGTKTAAEKRAEVDKMASSTLGRLLKINKSAQILSAKSYGYAVFDTRKFSFLMTTGSGAGVVVDKSTKRRTYMNMATGGAGVGMGIQFFELVFFFEDKASLNQFINQGWEANGAAAAVFGDDAIQQNARFVHGMAVYQLNEGGVMAAMNITGTRYWKSSELNAR